MLGVIVITNKVKFSLLLPTCTYWSPSPGGGGGEAQEIVSFGSTCRVCEKNLPCCMYPHLFALIFEAVTKSDTDLWYVPNNLGSG